MVQQTIPDAMLELERPELQTIMDTVVLCGCITYHWDGQIRTSDAT